MKKTTVVLFGIGGYGAKITKDLLDHMEDYGIELVGVCDPNYDAAPAKERLEQLGVAHYAAPEDFYREKTAELAIICTPIAFHEAHCLLAMEHGSHVLCEKPTAATLLQSRRMAEAAARLGKYINIGFQLSYVPAVLRLKTDIQNGVLGKPIRLTSLISWPRTRAYYARSWCAKVKFNGQYVLDSIAMNACAHYLHLLFFLLGDKTDTAAVPESAQALLLRANSIETFDTAMIRVQAAGAELQFLATHCGKKRIEPTMRFEFENATVEMTEDENEDAVRAVFKDGTVKRYGAIRPDFYRKIPYSCQVAGGNALPLCTPATADSHLKLVNAVTELVPVKTLTEVSEEKNVITVNGLAELLEEAFRKGCMPWDLTERYGKPTHLDLKSYVWRDAL